MRRPGSGATAAGRSSLDDGEVKKQGDRDLHDGERDGLVPLKATDPAATPGPPTNPDRLFYQVLALCADGITEGPN